MRYTLCGVLLLWCIFTIFLVVEPKSIDKGNFESQAEIQGVSIIVCGPMHYLCYVLIYANPPQCPRRLNCKQNLTGTCFFASPAGFSGKEKRVVGKNKGITSTVKKTEYTPHAFCACSMNMAILLIQSNLTKTVMCLSVRSHGTNHSQ